MVEKCKLSLLSLDAGGLGANPVHPPDGILGQVL